MFRDLGFDPQLHVSGERLGCVDSASLVNNISSNRSMISITENESHISSPRKLGSLYWVIDANHGSVNDFRVLEENTFQLSWRYCRETNL
jgi:hypothetical protein